MSTERPEKSGTERSRAPFVLTCAFGGIAWLVFGASLLVLMGILNSTGLVGLLSAGACLASSIGFAAWCSGATGIIVGEPSTNQVATIVGVCCAFGFVGFVIIAAFS